MAHIDEPDPLAPPEAADDATVPEAAEPTAEEPQPTATTLRTPDGCRLEPDRYAHLLCDPVWHPLLVDQRQIPLALGHAVRLATPASGEPWPSATAAACSRAAIDPPVGATRTTSCPGTSTEPPISSGWPCCVGTTTG